MSGGASWTGSLGVVPPGGGVQEEGLRLEAGTEPHDRHGIMMPLLLVVYGQELRS